MEIPLDKEFNLNYPIGFMSRTNGGPIMPKFDITLLKP